MKITKLTIISLVIAVILAGTCLVPASADEVFSDVVPYETYVYDYYGNPIITPHAYIASDVINGDGFGVGAFTAPKDIEVDTEGNIYVVDTNYNPETVNVPANAKAKDTINLYPESANKPATASSYLGRVVVLAPADATTDAKDLVYGKYTVKFIISEFYNNGQLDHFNTPSGIAIAPDKTIYVADTENSRVVKFSQDGKFIRQYDSPDITLLDESFVYKPLKLAVDGSHNMYVIATSVNMGIILLDDEGEFNGFVGAQKVSYNVVDYMWKSIQTQEQNDRSYDFVPTEYNNIKMDEKGFVFATTNSIESGDIDAAVKAKNFDSRYSPIKRLNPTGNDVLVRRGYFPTVGDVSYKFNSLGAAEVSIIKDVALGPNGRYTILDSQKNRLFTYSKDGELLYTFSANGIQKGNTTSPSSITYNGGDLLVLDEVNGTVTIFKLTKYGLLIDEAFECYSNYEYDKSVDYWNQVLHENANFDIAYDGIGNACMRTGEFREAMENFRFSNNKDRYSAALGEYRTTLIEKYLLIYVAIAIVIILVLVKLLSIVNKRNTDPKFNDKHNTFLGHFLYSFYIMLHPFDGFWDLKHEKRGSAKAASVIVLILAFVSLASKFTTNYLFNGSYGTKISVVQELSMILLPFLLWVVGNWSVTTLANGEGNMKDIYKFTGYALMPMILMTILNIPLSHIMIAEEVMYLTFFTSLGTAWSGFLLFAGNTQTHRYTVAKSIISMLLSVLGMAIIVFLVLVVVYTYQRIFNFGSNIVKEITYRF